MISIQKPFLWQTIVLLFPATASPLLVRSPSDTTDEDTCEAKCLLNHLKDSVGMIQCGMDCEGLLVDASPEGTEISDRAPCWWFGCIG